MTPSTLLELYCTRHGRKPELFVEEAFVRCIVPWRRPLVLLVRWLDPDLFAHDRFVLEEAAKATSYDDVVSAVDLLHYRARREFSFWRDLLGLRISGRRLLDLADALFVCKEVGPEQKVAEAR
jgi:hypothetical protein